MSTIPLVTDLISNSLVEIGDPAGQRISRGMMLQFYNRVCLRISTTLKCLEADEYFDLVGGEPRYAYPAGRVQMKALRLSKTDTPTQLSDYYWCDEKFNEEFRAATFAIRPIVRPTQYIARPNWFELLQTPPADIASGGIITVWARTTTLSSEADQVMELPDFLEGFIQDGMQILARRTGRERAAAIEDWKLWNAELEALRPAIEDPSDDRRASLRPPGHGFPTRGMR